MFRNLKAISVFVLVTFLLSIAAPAIAAGHEHGRHGHGGGSSRPQRVERSSGNSNSSSHHVRRDSGNNNSSSHRERPERFRRSDSGSNGNSESRRERMERFRRSDSGSNGNSESRSERMEKFRRHESGSDDGKGSDNEKRRERMEKFRRHEFGSDDGKGDDNDKRRERMEKSRKFEHSDHDKDRHHKKKDGRRDHFDRKDHHRDRDVHYHIHNHVYRNRPIVVKPRPHYHRYHRPHYRYHYTRRTYHYYYSREREDLAALAGFAGGLLIASILQSNAGASDNQAAKIAIQKELSSIADSEIAYLMDAIKNIGAAEALLAIEDDWKQKSVRTEYRPGDPLNVLIVSNAEGIDLVYGIDTAQGIAVVTLKDKKHNVKESRSVMYDDPAYIGFDGDVVGFDITDGERTPEGYLKIISVNTDVLGKVDGMYRGAAIYKIDKFDTSKDSYADIAAYITDKAAQHQSVIVEVDVNGIRKPVEVKW